MERKKKAEFPSGEAEHMTSAQIARYLGERERRFAGEYLIDLNGTQAAVRAGFSAGKNNASAAVTASRLLRDERVKAYRAALIRESVEDMAVSREAVALKLIEIFRRCMAAEPVLIWSSEQHAWVNSGEWRFDARGASKALEQLSNLLGYDAPKKMEHSGLSGIEALLRELDGERSYE